MKIILTETQKSVLKKIKKWYKKNEQKYFVLSGCAGSGKSTLVKYIIEEIGISESVVSFMAYTGKAAQVLAAKGHPNSSTIHSKIYNFREDKRGNFEKILKMRSDLRSFKLFIVDECSMLNEELIDDLLFFNIPIIFIGDHNQLDPIEGNNFLLENPDIRLNEPLRQAKESSIIELSEAIFNGTKLNIGRYGNNVWIVDKLPLKTFKNANQVICGYNKTRRKYNTLMRLGKEKDFPIKGEKLICKKNNWEKYVFTNVGELYLTNGLIGMAGNTVVRYSGLDFYPEITYNKFECKFDSHFWETGKELKGLKKYDKFDLGYCITTHASQGSEYENCVVIVEPIGSTNLQKRKWLYTAITRAKSKLILKV